MTIFTPVSELSVQPKGNVKPGQALFESGLILDGDPGNSIGLVAQEVYKIIHNQQEAASQQQIMLELLELEVEQLKREKNKDQL